jgi:hypothetical protein
MMPARRPCLSRHLSLIAALALAGAAAPPAAAAEPLQPEASSAETEQQARRAAGGLARRPDERRLAEGHTFELFGQTMRFSGEHEITHETRRNFDLDHRQSRDRARLDQELKLELSFAPSPDTSVFLQLVGLSEIDTWRQSGKKESIGTVERGQMWVFLAQPGGLPLDLQAGRIGLIEARSWWWDDDLDAIRVFFGDDRWLLETGISQQLTPVSTDEERIDPEREDLARWFGRAAWMWRKRHNLEAYWLLARDHSGRPEVGRIVREKRADAADGNLDWYGVRAIGEERTEGGHRFGYWLDAARLTGREWRTEFDEVSDKRVQITEQTRQRVDASAWDVGVRWSLPGPARPTAWLGWASGSGDGNAADGVDHTFRQTGLQENKGRFGGVKRFRYYGELFRPELANLTVRSAGLGMRFLDNSSVDLVLHDYRQRRASTRLFDTRLDSDPTGESRDLGREVDLFFAFRESKQIEFTASLAAFRAGRAFGADEGEVAHFLDLGMTVNF